ncbi:MAG: hypothetical protein ABR613_03420 [Actinomycetota bacterium]
MSRVKLAGGTATAKIRSSRGAPIESEAVGPMGIFQASGTNGAVAVRTFAGGSGVLGAGDCTASREPAQGALRNTVTLPHGAVVTAIVVTGTGTVRMTTAALNSNLPLANFTVNAQNPNEVLSFGTGFTAPSELTLTGIDGTNCNFVILGQGPGEHPLTP